MVKSAFCAAFRWKQISQGLLNHTEQWYWYQKKLNFNLGYLKVREKKIWHKKKTKFVCCMGHVPLVWEPRCTTLDLQSCIALLVPNLWSMSPHTTQSFGLIRGIDCSIESSHCHQSMQHYKDITISAYQMRRDAYNAKIEEFVQRAWNMINDRWVTIATKVLLLFSYYHSHSRTVLSFQQTRLRFRKWFKWAGLSSTIGE